jgi:anti-anti-sigma factor
MDLSVRANANNIADIQVGGPITQAHVSPTQEPLAAALGTGAYAHRVLLDLSHAEHVDSSGVNWLLTLHRRTKEHGGRLVLHSLPPLVDNVLKVLRMNQVFEIAPNKEQARKLVEGDTP